MKKIYLITMVCLLAVFGAQAQPILQESFEGSFPPAGWTLINNGTGNAWTQNTTATYAYNGTRSMQYAYNFSNAADAWAITPALSVSTAPVTVTFWVRVRSATYPEALKLTVGTGTTVADQSTILLDSNNLTNTVFQQWSVQWTPPSAGTYYFGFNCYSAANMWNVYVDSLTISTILPGCSGAVTGGTTVGPNAGVCPNTSINLSVNGGSGGSSGFTYQWDSSSNGTTWYAIAGATNPTYSTIGTTSTYFRRNITCTNSSTTDVSTPLLVSINPVILCPCSPNNGTTLHSSTSPGITNIDLQPAAYTFAHTTIPTNGYTLANDTNSYPTLSQAVTYTLTNTYSATPTRAAVWVDWNQDGIFDATTEHTLLTISGTGSVDQITVPANAALGFTIMRIRCRAASFTASDACGTFGSGETVDIIIKVTAGTQCSGTPNGGTTSSTDTSVCPNKAFTLNVANGSSGVAGFTYQWESSTDGVNWSPIATATNNNYAVTSGITTSTYFRRSITCSGATSYSASLLVSVKLPLQCICTPPSTTLHSSTSPGMTVIDFQPAGFNYAHTTIPTNGYTGFNDTNQAVIVFQGLTYTLTNTYSGTPTQASVWIDWNQDGLFDATEYQLLTISGTGSTDQIAVPATSNLGFVMMRIRCRAATYTASDACGTFGSGETVDVLLKVAQGVNCSGAPLGGITGSTTPLVCPQSAFSVNVTGDTKGVLGLTYQWESSTDSVTWNAIAGATNANYTETSGVTVATYYRRQIACSGGQPVYSTPIKISLKPSLLCICNPNSGTTLHSFTSPSVDSVVFDGNKLLGVHKVPNNGYTQATSTATVTQGVSYSLYTKYSASSISGLWIDWNQDGVLDATEYTALAQSATTNTTSISVPSTSLLGTTLMRIRVGGTFSGLNSNGACSTLTSGETVDFLLTVVAGTSCSGAPVAGTTVVSNNGSNVICANSPFALQVNGATSNQIGLSYQWESSTDSINWSPISGETNTTLTITAGITATTYYRRMIDCSGFQDFSTPIAMSIGAYSTPVTESFENLPAAPGTGVLPTCWTTVASASTSVFSTTSTYRNNMKARTGNNVVFSRWSSTSWLVTPPVNLTAGTAYNFIYYYRPSDAIAGYTVNNFVANQGDTLSLAAGTALGSFVDPTDTSKWTAVSYTFTPTTSGVYYFGVQSSCPTFSPWYLYFDDFYVGTSGLPVNLVSFDGKRTNKVNQLTWKTATEINNKGFEVQRSLDGKSFETIGFIASKANNGNSNFGLEYSFVDNKSPNVTSYYRLKQVDHNGKFAISKVVTLKADKVQQVELVSIYPNPAKDNIKIVINSPVAQKVTVVISDVVGKVVLEKTLQLNAEGTVADINIQQLQASNYFIKVVCNSGCETTTQKFVKQ